MVTFYQFEEENEVLKCFFKRNLTVVDIMNSRESFYADFDQFQDVKKIIVDCGQVQVIDSVGISILIKMYLKSKKLKQNFQVINCSKYLYHIFDSLGLTKFLGIQNTQQ